MSKNIYILFVLILLFSCNSKEDNQKRIIIGFSQSISEADSWRKSMDNTMMVEASLHPEIDLTICNADGSTKKQIADIEKMIENHLDVLIVAPYGSDSIVPVIEKANAKGIPVIIVDRKVNTENYTSYLGADNVEVGHIAGKYIVSKSNAHGTILEIKATTAISPSVERSLGFKQIIDQYPNIKKISITAPDLASINKNLSKVLDSMPKIDYVFAFNDIIALQAWEVAKQKGREKNIKFIGIDGLNDPNGGIQAVKDGKLSATILYPTGGSEAIKLAIKLANKEMVSKNNTLNTILIDSLNADIMSNQFDRINLQQSDIKLQQNKIKEQEEKYSTQRNLLIVIIFFSLLILGLAVFSVYSVIKLRSKKKELEKTNIQIVNQKDEIELYADKLKISNEAKINFFTGLSHEFKTPLTLILSSIESLHDEFKNKNSGVKKDLDLMYNNSKRLLRLINQLLDFRKGENQNFDLKATKTNLWSFSKKIVKEFEREALRRNIKFDFSTNNKGLEVYIDQNLIDKVYYNLLSNSFKFTPDNGKIDVSIIEEKENGIVKIHFKDSGIGIPEKDLANVFIPFFKGSNNYKNGSGIGLNLSKSFMDLHHGSIEAKSNKGMHFTLTLKLGSDHFNTEEIIENSNDQNFENDYEYNYLDKTLNEPSSPLFDENKQSILIIEDNVEVLDFISSKLSESYNVFECNGIDSVELVLATIPDVVICDLNLPEKNGFEICEIIKSNFLTSHIPTIILTASDDYETNIKALEAGADLFLTKPFNLQVLRQAIKGLLFNREKLRYFYTNAKVETEVKGFDLIEKKFIAKINQFIDENIDDSSFSVEDLAALLNISRVQLYRKVKAVLGIGIGDYINNYRLEKAKVMLKTTSLNISEIAYSCGFASPNYFSTSFKSKYSISPKDYRNI
ncbi:hybrid sensor histidine kinase/response regulator transcription factor [Flavobacterium aestuarii]|uniref:hybrid sensor histidine kinase/response regulator transcription factor n=1 Tax=Flavobacterium aestuarii TaxID=3149227 RepID=UPI0032B41865